MGSVGEVQALETQRQFISLRNPEVAEKAEIELGKTRSSQPGRAAPGCAQAFRLDWLEGRRVEPVLPRAGAFCHVQWAHKVRDLVCSWRIEE